MKMKNMIGSVLMVGLLVSGFGCATGKEDEGDAAQLEATAKISRAEAEKTALAKVPGGTIKEGGIEKEKGKVVWSFDISMPGTTDIMEVQVDAQTGAIVAMDKESAAREAKEKKHEEKEEKDEKK